MLDDVDERRGLNLDNLAVVFHVDLVPRHHFAAAEHAVPGQKVNVLLQNERGQRVGGGDEVCKAVARGFLEPASLISVAVKENPAVLAQRVANQGMERGLKVVGLFQNVRVFAERFCHDRVEDDVGLETVPALLFFLIIFFIPESPRWLVLRNKDVVAGRILQRIYGSKNESEIQINAIRQVIGKESKSEWAMLLQPGILKAVMIGVAIAILGQFMGVNAVLYYGPSIFEKSGLSNGDSLFYQVLVGTVNMLTTVLALVIIDKVGRKKLVYYGVSGMILSLILIAFYFIKGAELGIPSIALLVFFLSYIFCCAISICAVIWVLLSEMYPIKVRGLAMSIAGFSLWIGTYLIGQLTPWMLQTITPAGTFLIFAGMCIPYMLIIWKLVPETTGKSLEEIEKNWIK